MSKVPMKRVLIAGMKGNRKAILEDLQRASVVQVTSEEIEDSELQKLDVSKDSTRFLRNVQKLEQSLELLSLYAPEEKGLLDSLAGEIEIDKKQYEERRKNVSLYVNKADEIIALGKRIGELEGNIPKLENKIQGLTPWMSLDVPLDFDGTEKTKFFVGSVKNEWNVTNLTACLEEKLEDGTDYELNILSSSKEQTCFYIVTLRENAEALEEALRKISFSRAPLIDRIPKEEERALKEEIRNAEREIEDCRIKIAQEAEIREDLQFTSDYYQMRADKYAVLSTLPQSKNVFFVYGYVPANYAEPLKNKLTKAYEDAVVEIEEPGESEDVPVALQNGFFTDPMETVVESYSLPSKGEIDPSRILAFFYYVFFGLMLSDAGYGLLLVLGCGIALLKVPNMKKDTKRLLKLFFFSGVSTVFWGIMFGSFFGDAVNVIATAFFNRPDIALRPLWFEPLSDPMRMLVFAFALGIIHLFTGLFIKIYLCIKHHDYAGAICDGLFWVAFVGGGILYLLTMPMITGMLGLNLNFGENMATVAAVIAIVGFAGVILTGGRESKNIFKRLLKGAYAAYGVTGWLSDILSYSRLLALGLATGVIAQVFNKMGSMLGTAWYGVLIFIIVFLIGHVLNLAINVLGAYVHTNRLQFVEFFGKFYEGGGREYKPFKENTKYFNVKEDK